MYPITQGTNPTPPVRRKLDFTADEAVVNSVAPAKIKTVDLDACLPLSERSYTVIAEGDFAKLYLQLQKNWGATISELNTVYRKGGSKFEADKRLGTAYYEMGLMATHEKEYIVSIRLFEESLKYSPKSAKVQYQMGYSYLKQNLHNAAGIWFDFALKDDPTFAPAWAAKGIIARIKKMRDDSIKYFQAACSNDNCDLYRDQLIEAILIDDDNAPDLRKKGYRLIKEKRSEEGVALLAKAYELDPDDRDRKDLNYACRILAERAQLTQDFAKVRYFHSIALKMTPGDPASLLARGKANYELKSYYNAIDDLEQIKDSYEGLAYLGASLHKVKQFGASIKVLNQANKPDDPFIQQQLKEAYRSFLKDLKTL